jgi:hypothetical protein
MIPAPFLAHPAFLARSTSNTAPGTPPPRHQNGNQILEVHRCEPSSRVSPSLCGVAVLDHGT